MKAEDRERIVLPPPAIAPEQQSAIARLQRELFVGLLEHLKYRITNGTISDLRERVYRLLKACQVEMIILDESHRFRPKTFSEIRDIFDLLGISIVLVETDRLDAVVRRDEQVHNRFMAWYLPSL